MHNKTRKNCIKLIKTIEKCKKVVYYEAINKEETGRGTMNNEGGDVIHFTVRRLSPETGERIFDEEKR